MTTIRDSFGIARGSYQPNFDHWTADRHGDLCRLGEHMERLAWIVGAALYLVCLPALRRGAWSRATST